MQHHKTEMLARAGQLLLEYNESTGAIHRALAATARKLSDANCEVAVTYSGVVVSLGDEGPLIKPVHELRYNAALQANVHSILDQVRRGNFDAAQALERLNRVEAETPRHPNWLVAVLLGVAAAGLAGILGADMAAVIVSGVSTALGLLARRELGRRHFSLLVLPLSAALIGAVLGGFAIRFGWTGTPGLALVVPSLMIIPGPHLINGLLDLVDNYLPMAVARLGLATAIMAVSALGIVLGIELTLDYVPSSGGSAVDHLNLMTDMLLAGIVTCGFAVFYNANWTHTGLAMLGGMAGHGTRYIALEMGCRLEAATFLGGFAVGIVAALIARSYKLPFAVVAFAGAVTMMPGLQIYRSLGGALQLARLRSEAELPLIANLSGNAMQSGLVVSALALGLIVAERVVPMLVRDKGPQHKHVNA
jgi:uncharacterized membrane protein YjjP (DUF1212 family)